MPECRPCISLNQFPATFPVSYGTQSCPYIGQRSRALSGHKMPSYILYYHCIITRQIADYATTNTRTHEFSRVQSRVWIR